MSWFGVEESPKKESKKNTPGGRASLIGKFSEEQLDHILNDAKHRGAKITFRKPKQERGTLMKHEVVILTPYGKRLHPDRIVMGVPGYENGFYIERKSQGSQGSAEEKYAPAMDYVCQGCYPLPVAFVMTLEPAKHSEALTHRWGTILKYMRKKSSENKKLVVGVFTLMEFKYWIEERCFPYDQ